MGNKYLSLDEELYGYLVSFSSRAKDDVLDELRQETEEKFPDWSRMLVSREQGNFLSLLVGLMGVESAIEIGTFTGYSSICIARAMEEKGKLICCDQSEEWTSVARVAWEKAQVTDKIELKLGVAKETIASLKEENSGFDLAFIDADKANYDSYYEAILPLIRKNGLIVFDNMLWGGRVVDASITDEDTVAIRELNRKLANDERIESVLIPLGDGIHFCRKK